MSYGRTFASFSAALGWTAAAMADYEAHWHSYTLALAIFNAAYWWLVAFVAAWPKAVQG